MSEWMEYVFFDLALAERFKGYCQALGAQTRLEEDVTHTGEASYTVGIPDSLTDAVIEQIEDEYSEILFGEQAERIEGNERGLVADACGVQVQLQSGEYTTVAIHPGIMNKILSVLSIDELQQFLSQVAEDIENPKNGPICARKDLPTI